jgi:AraC-like DNA-binding protein
MDMARLVALAGCSVERPGAWAGRVEVIAAAPAVRSFPTRVSTGVGLCLKHTGRDHAVVADARALRYPTGALCLRPPGCVWSAEVTDASFLSIDIDPTLLPDGATFGGMTFVAPDRRWPLVSRIAQMIRAPEALAREEALSHLVEFTAGAGFMKCEELQRDAHSLPAARARDFLSADPCTDVSLDELARHAGANKYVLLRAFRRKYGLTPHAYRVRLRVQLARDLIGARMPLADVASTLGYADQSHLGRHFKRIVGMTPGEYARLLIRASSLATPGARRVV